VSGANLGINHLSFPPLPVDHRILIGGIELAVLPVKEDKYVVLKDGQEITQFIPVIFEGVRIAPQL
jgi:hypothetical protein